MKLMFKHIRTKFLRALIVTSIFSNYFNVYSQYCQRGRGYDEVPTLYNRDKQIVLKGDFRNYKLHCGVKYIYDDSCRLRKLEIYRFGSYLQALQYALNQLLTGNLDQTYRTEFLPLNTILV